MWGDRVGEVDADSDFDADLPTVISALDQLDVPLLDNGFDAFADTAVVRAEGTAALVTHHADGLVDRVASVPDDGAIAARRLDQAEDWDALEGDIPSRENDDFDDPPV